MTFNELKKLRDSEKIILVELDLPIVNDFLISDQEGIWYKVLTPEEIILFGGVFNPDRNTFIFVDVPSVKVIYNEQISNYTKTSNRNDLLAQEDSFYYDASTSKIYFHFENFDPPLSRVIKIGAVSGFCDKAGTVNQGRYNDILYETRVNNVPSIKYKKDPITFGVLQFQNVSYGLNNQDGYFDNLGIRQISRQQARLYFGFDTLDRDDFQLIHTSIIEDFSRSFTNYTIKGIDFRNQLNRSVPDNIYNTTDYPNMDTDDEGEFIPLAYGVIVNAPCIQIDTGTNTFKMCDTTYNPVKTGTVTAYKDGVAVSSGISYDYTNGTFTLSTYNDEEITADFTVDLENPLDAAKDLIENWGSVAYIDTNFNTDEWEKETNLNSGYKFSKYIDSATKIIDIIADICKSANGVFYTQKSGLYTFKSYDANRLITRRIHNSDWIDDPQETNPQDDFLSSVVIKYGKDINEDKYKQYINNDYRLTAIEKYSIENTRDIEANLSDETSAIALSEEIMDIAQDIVPVIKRTTYMEYIDIELMDFIEAAHDRDGESLKVWEVIGIDYNFNNYTMTLTMRFVKDADIYTQGFYCTNSNLSLNFCSNGFSGAPRMTSGFGLTQYTEA